jgi:hypothetical protein
MILLSARRAFLTIGNLRSKCSDNTKIRHKIPAANFLANQRSTWFLATETMQCNLQLVMSISCACHLFFFLFSQDKCAHLWRRLVRLQRMCRIMHASERHRSIVCLQQVVYQNSREMFDIIHLKCDEATVKQPDNAAFVCCLTCSSPLCRPQRSRTMFLG